MFSDRTNWKLEPNSLTLALEQARARSSKILDLTVSNPTRVGLNYDSQSILQALAFPGSLDYDPQPKGLREARKAVADYYAEDHGVRDLDLERVVLTTSTSEAYSFVFRLLCNPADELLVPKPSYPLFEFLADLQDVRLVPYELIYDHGWQMDFHSMEKAATPRSRAVIVVHPNNPTGSYIRSDELAALNSFCRERQLALIADEVFLDYALESSTHPTFAANEQVLTFTLSGLSKIAALPQMKAAWIVTSGPADEVKISMLRLEVIADTFLSMNAPMQWAMPKLLAQRKSIQAQLIQRAKRNLMDLDRQLGSHLACRRLEVQAGWNAILRVPARGSDEDLAIELLRKKSVLVHPGHFYDFPGEGYLVLSLITPTECFSQGVAALLQTLNT